MEAGLKALQGVLDLLGHGGGDRDFAGQGEVIGAERDIDLATARDLLLDCGAVYGGAVSWQ